MNRLRGLKLASTRRFETGICTNRHPLFSGVQSFEFGKTIAQMRAGRISLGISRLALDGLKPTADPGTVRPQVGPAQVVHPYDARHQSDIGQRYAVAKQPDASAGSD